VMMNPPPLTAMNVIYLALSMFVGAVVAVVMFAMLAGGKQ